MPYKENKMRKKMPDIYEKLIDNTLECLDRAESEWAKNYWSTNLAILMRKLKERTYNGN